MTGTAASTPRSVTTGADPAPPTHRRRLWRVLALVAAVLVALGALFYAAGGWYFSGRIASGALNATPSDGSPSYNLVVTAVSSGQVSMRATGSAPLALTQPTAYVLRWPGGSGYVGASPAASGGTVTRSLSDVVGTPPTVGAPAMLERDWYLGDPKTSLGLDFTEVSVAGPLSALPAWYVPARASTWVVMVHGKSGLRREFLRALPTVHAAGMPALVVTYRNDLGVAPEADGRYGYGASEWPDLQASVDWALGHGAEHVVLYGQSMGGAVVAAFLEHSDRASRVSGVVLDSAMLDFDAVVRLGASQTSLPVVGLSVPTSLTWTAERIAGVRYGVDWSALNYVAHPTWLTVPALVIHGTADPKVPVSVSERLAAARPELVTLEVFAKAGHIEAWNTDRARFEAALAAFLHARA